MTTFTFDFFSTRLIIFFTYFHLLFIFLFLFLFQPHTMASIHPEF
jgi:hypothetical protein